MTPEYIALVKDSFRKLSSAPDDVGRVFYARLFNANPKLRALFPGDMNRQSRALTAMLEMIVKTLDLQDKLVPLIHYLGERHAVFNVKPEHYRPFGEGLMWTLPSSCWTNSRPRRGAPRRRPTGSWWRT